MFLMNWAGILMSSFVISSWLGTRPWYVLIGLVGLILLIISKNHSEIAASLKRKGRLED